MCVFLYFKEEMVGENGRDFSLLGCILLAGMIHPTLMQWYPVVCPHCPRYHGRAAAESERWSSNPATQERVAPG